MLEPQIHEVRRWYLSGPDFKIRCSTKDFAIKLGRIGRQAGKDVSLIEEYDLFDGDVHTDHQEFDRTILISL